MSTYIQLILEVTDGDDLAFTRSQRDDEICVVVNPEFATSDTAKGDVVQAKLHSFGYIPGEALE